MRLLAIGALTLALSIPVTAMAAPAPGPAFKDFASGPEVQAMIEYARTHRTNEASFVQPLLRLAPYRANLEYRAAVGPAALHEHEAELFYVVQGAANLVTGGKLVKETRPNPDNLSGEAIADGQERRVSQGDFFIVPEKTPHQFTDIDQQPLVLMTIHIPRG